MQRIKQQQKKGYCKYCGATLLVTSWKLCEACSTNEARNKRRQARKLKSKQNRKSNYKSRLSRNRKIT